MIGFVSHDDAHRDRGLIAFLVENELFSNHFPEHNRYNILYRISIILSVVSTIRSHPVREVR